MLNFWNAPYPFNDFLVHVSTNGIVRPPIEKLEKVGVDCVSIKRMGQTSCLIASTVSGCDTSKTIISGVSKYKGKFIFGQQDVPEDCTDAVNDEIGIFTSIHFKDNEIVISQDILGCGILFYSEMDGAMVVSNRYHLLLLYLSWIGYKGKINPAKMVSSLYAHTTFLGQNVSSEMDILGTYQLPQDKEISVNEKGWEIREKKIVKELLAGCESYQKDSLLEQSKEEIIENVQSVIQSGRFSRYVTDLSGGFDSRAVFAAILNIQDSNKIFQINTNDVPGSADLSIAAGIKNRYGFEFYQEGQRPQQPITVTENNNMWRSYLMGTYYRLGALPWSPKGQNNNQIRLSGGCGELYRTFWYKIYGEKLGKPKEVYDLSSKLVKSFHCMVTERKSTQEQMIETITTELSNIPGESPMSKLENHYLYFRNRYHFGMRAIDYYNDSPAWFPLMSKSLFKIANSSSLEEKKNNAIMLDLTYQLKSELVKIDYDSIAFEENHDLRKLGIKPKDKIDLITDTSDWLEVKERNREMTMQSRKKMDSFFNESWRNVNIIQEHELYENLWFLREHIQNDIINDEFIRNIEKYKGNRSFIGTLSAKLNSLTDQIQIFY